MVEIIGGLIEQFLVTIPSKRNRAINKKFRRLRKEIWFKGILERYSALIFIQMNNSVRNFIEQTDIEKILKFPEETKKFQIEFENLLSKENL